MVVTHRSNFLFSPFTHYHYNIYNAHAEMLPLVAAINAEGYVEDSSNLLLYNYRRFYYILYCIFLCIYCLDFSLCDVTFYLLVHKVYHVVLSRGFCQLVRPSHSYGVNLVKKKPR